MNKNLSEKSLPRRRPKPQQKVECFFDEVMTNNRSVNEIVFANLIVITAVFLSAFVPLLSLGLPILVLLYFSVGLWGFIYKKESGKRYRYENLFTHPKILIKSFCLFVIKIFSALFWMLCLIVPGIIFLLDHCFCCLILYESPDLDVKGVMMLSKELVKGYRLKIFFFACFCLSVVCISMSLAFSIILLFDYFLVVVPAVYIVLVLFAGMLSFILLALPLFEVVLVDSYISAKKSLCP